MSQQSERGDESRDEKSNGKAPRGFARLSREDVRELARRGGTSAHRTGRAHEFTSDEAREAGRKGGLAPHRNRKPDKNDKDASKQ